MAFDLKNTFSFLKREATTVSGGDDRAVGIDIGSASIKVVELKKVSGNVTLSTYGELQLGPYSELPVGATQKLEHEQAVQALIDVIRESGVSATKGVLSVPLASSFLTTITLEAESYEDVVKMIPVEARKYIPLPLKEVALDWYEIEPEETAEKNTTQHDVLLAAIQNESLTNYQRLLSAVGMHAQPTEIEAFSTIRAVIEDLEASSLVIDIGASMSKLYVVKGTTLQKLHRVKTGGEQITKRLAELRSIDFADAEIIKRDLAGDAEYAKDVKTALTATLGRPFQEFRRVIQQYQQAQNMTFKKVYVVGGSAQLDHMAEFVSEQLSLEPVLYNPFEKISYPAFMSDVLNELGSSFAVALGAALRPYME